MPQSVPGDRPHSDLTRSILESAMRVQSALGVGLYEKPYKVCLAHALRQKGHRVLMEVKLDITFEGLLVPESYRIDVLVDDTVVVEAKTVERLTPIHQAQVLTYLRLSGKEVGLLPHRERAQPRGLSHPAQRPMRSVGRLFLGGHAHDLSLTLLRDDRLHSSPRRIVLNARASRRQEPVSPASDCVVTHPKLVGGGPDPGSLREQQEDPRSFHDPGRNRLAPGPACKLSTVLRRHL